MRTVTLKLPAALALRLKQTVARRGTTQSKIIRDALEAHLGALRRRVNRASTSRGTSPAPFAAARPISRRTSAT